MNLMEATIFAILLTNPAAPFQCRQTVDEKQAICSNDLTFAEGEDGRLMYSNNIVVSKNKRRQLVFSNGITSYFDSFGWLQFSNGYAVRRIEGDVFKIAPPDKRGDMLCRYTIPNKLVRCSPA